MCYVVECTLAELFLLREIINPEKKEFIVREVHSYHDKFESIGVMKVKLMEEFSENVPKTLDFNVGYLLANKIQNIG